MSRKTELRGYIRGLQAAAEYLGISDRETLRSWCKEFNLPPRIIHGQAYFKISTLDRFMDPVSNAPGAEEQFWRGTTTSPN
jgi:hypothetical protein